MAVKNHYYVLVLTEEGPMFVTGFEEHHTACWDKLATPLDLSKEVAEDVANGLRLNLFTAYAVRLPYSMSTQPYCYNKGHFEWKWDAKSSDIKEEK